jgi:hypothetical protein
MFAAGIPHRTPYACKVNVRLHGNLMGCRPSFPRPSHLAIGRPYWRPLYGGLVTIPSHPSGLEGFCQKIDSASAVAVQAAFPRCSLLVRAFPSGILDILDDHFDRNRQFYLGGFGDGYSTCSKRLSERRCKPSALATPRASAAAASPPTRHEAVEFLWHL